MELHGVVEIDRDRYGGQRYRGVLLTGGYSYQLVIDRHGLVRIEKMSRIHTRKNERLTNQTRMGGQVQTRSNARNDISWVSHMVRSEKRRVLTNSVPQLPFPTSTSRQSRCFLLLS